jgi:chemotaxis protein methyltransferase CheR
MTQYPYPTLPQNNFLLQKNGNELTLSDVTFENFRKMIYDSCGIYFQDNKKYLLESRLLKRINFLGMSNYEEYLDYLRLSTTNGQEKRYLYEAITINETFFFRNQPQLDAFVTTVVPQIVTAKDKYGRCKLRVWSAASSSGEEAYSIAITFFDQVKPKYPSIELEIVGTDINNAVIETAKSGLYKEYSIRNTPAYYLKKYFKQVGSTFEIDPNIKKAVSFRNLNLFDDASMHLMSNFDIIFCANVLIYFDMRAKVKVISNLHSSLNKGGYLFIGYAETLHTVSKAFTIVSFPKTIGYKKE